MDFPGHFAQHKITPMLVLLLKVSVTLLGARFLYFLCEGFYWRRKFRQWKSQGVPMLEHSLLYGHLAAWVKLKKDYPRDAGSFRVVPMRILNNWREYFPNEPECPPFMLLDSWPLEPPSIFVWDPEQIHRFTVEKPAARNSKYFMTPVTGGHDLLSVDMPTHREWRARLSNGFSQRKLIARMPAVLEEVDIFTRKIKDLAGANGAWGDVFPLEEPATSLTLDVIGRIALDARLGEQLHEESVFKTAMLEQIKHMKAPSLRADARRLNPVWQYNKWKNHKAMDSVILPKLEAQKDKNAKDATLVDLVLGDDQESGKTSRSGRNSAIVQGLISNIKSFAFAGHDTTATTICWIFHNLSRHPSATAKLKAEHEEVFGSDPRKAPDVLSQFPQKINDLPYTLAVIKETLRTHAIVHSFRKGDPSLELTTARTRVNTDGFLIITAGAALHLHPELWHKAEDFIPERWLVPKGDPLYPPPHGWRPFEHGPLNCIGQELALIELKLVLIRLVREVEIVPAWEKWDKLQGYTEAEKTTVDGQRAYPTNRGGGLLKPKDGMPVHVRLL